MRRMTPEPLKFEDVQERAIRNLKIEVQRVNWFSTYRVHHRVANAFAKGRASCWGTLRTSTVRSAARE
jgi:hypothetical protein